MADRVFPGSVFRRLPATGMDLPEGENMDAIGIYDVVASAISLQLSRA